MTTTNTMTDELGAPPRGGSAVMPPRALRLDVGENLDGLMRQLARSASGYRPAFPVSAPEPEPAPTGGRRYNSGKVRYDLIPPDALAQLAKVYTIGAEKYDDRNWEKGFPWMECYGSLMRHIQAWAQGEDLDVGPNGEFGPDHENFKWTGLPHMALAAWNCMALLTFHLRDAGQDDRVVH